MLKGHRLLGRLSLLPHVILAWLALWRARRALAGPGGERILRRFPLADGDSGTLPAEVEARARRIARALAAACRRLPNRPGCLVQALAAVRLLQQSAVPARLYLGVRAAAFDQLEAHAWVKAGDFTVCGGRPEGRFKVLSIHVPGPLHG